MLMRPAPPVEAIAGKHADSLVYYNIRNRQLARTWVYPFNPNTFMQALLRGYFATISAAWKTVSDSQAIAWEELANQLGGTDSLGRAYGFYVNNAFMQVNLYRLIDGQTITLNPPAYDPQPPASAVIELIWNESEEANISITHSLPAGTFIFVQLTPFLNSQRRQARRNELRIPTTSLAASIVARASSPQSFIINPARVGWPAAQGYVGIRLLSLSSGYLPGGELFVTSFETEGV